jgi:anaerobic magnesium-protoporphyrin IX monomethyl ester cyclase
MKVLLTDPVFDFIPLIKGYYYPNIGLLSIAAYLENNGIETRVVEPFAEKLNWRRLLLTIKNEKPHIVGISSLTHNAYYAMALAKLVKDINKDIVTIVGGRHFTAVSEDTFAICQDIDYIVIGEGEVTFLELVKNIALNREKKDMLKTKGLAFILDNKVFKTEPRPLIEDLDTLPFPAYHLIGLNKIKVPFTKNNNLGCTFARGCNQACGFCTEDLLWHRRWRSRSARSIIDELELLVKKYGRNDFNFNDTDFLSDRSRNINFLEGLAKRKLNIHFRVSTQAKTVLENRDLLGHFREVGLAGIIVGFESFSQDNLRRWNKRLNQEEIELAANCIVNAKIPTFEALFILDPDKDQPSMLRKMVSKSLKFKVTGLWCSLLTPFPKKSVIGTPKSEEGDTIIDYRRYDIRHATGIANNNSTNKIEMAHIVIYLLWWYNPLVFIKNMFNRESRRMHIFQLFYDFQTFLRMLRVIDNNIFNIENVKKYRLEIEKIYRRHLKLCKRPLTEQKSLKFWTFRYN